MRRAILGLGLCLLPWSAFGQWARGDVITRAPVQAPAPPRLGRIPSVGYDRVQRVALPGIVTSPLTALPRGGYAVAVAATGRVFFLDADGHPQAEAPAEEPLHRPLVVCPNGMIAAASDGANALIGFIAPDGTVRNTQIVRDYVPQSLVARADGTLAALTHPQSAPSELVLLSPDGERAESRTLLGGPEAPPVLDRLGTLWVPFGSLLGSLDARGRWSFTPFVPHVSTLVALDGGGLAAASEGTVLLTDARGRIRTRLDFGGHNPVWLAPLPGGRVGALKLGTPTEFWMIDAAGHGEARSQLPVGSSPPLLDDTGAMLVVTTDGDLIALNSDGSSRWHMALNEQLRPPAIPLAGGGFVVATQQHGVVFVR